MIAKATVLAAFAAIGCDAFTAPMGLRMSAAPSRREVVQAGAAAAAVSPFLNLAPASAVNAKFGGKAPVLTSRPLEFRDLVLFLFIVHLYVISCVGIYTSEWMDFGQLRRAV